MLSLSCLIQYFWRHEFPCIALFVTFCSLLVTNTNPHDVRSVICVAIFSSVMQVLSILTAARNMGAIIVISDINVVSETSVMGAISDISGISVMSVIGLRLLRRLLVL